MAADTVREECDERTGKHRENEAAKDRDPLHAFAAMYQVNPEFLVVITAVLAAGKASLHLSQLLAKCPECLPRVTR